MFGSKKPSTVTFDFDTIAQELDQLLDTAEAAHMNRHQLIDLLESRAAGLVRRNVANDRSLQTDGLHVKIGW